MAHFPPCDLCSSSRCSAATRCRSASARRSSASSASRRSSARRASSSARRRSASAQLSSSSCAAANALNISSSSLAASASARRHAARTASSFASISLLVIVVVVVMKGTKEKKNLLKSKDENLSSFICQPFCARTSGFGPKGEILLYASTRVTFSIIPVTSPSFPSCLRHSRHFSITAVSLFSVPFVIVFHRLSVFCLSSIPSLRIYSAPVMFRASFLGFVAALSYFNIFTFLWLDNKFIVFMIL